VHQFSVLTDWHWANNALYMYEHIAVDSTQVPYEALPFHRMTQAYFDTIPDQWRNFSPRIGGIYFRHPYGPLKTYMRRYQRAHPNNTDIEGWGQVAPVYGLWGKHMIKKHPVAYAWYYLMPNTLNYFLPPLEKLVTYNYGGTAVPPMVAQWFDYPKAEVRVVSKDLSSLALLLVPMVFMMLNVAFVAGSIWFLVKGYYRKMPVVWHGLMLAMIVWVLNTGFNILAAPVAVRYLMYPFMVFTGFAVVLIDLWVKENEEAEKAVNVVGEKSAQSTVHSPQ
jgi:hypothetical protein